MMELKDIEAARAEDQVWIVVDERNFRCISGFIRGPPDTPYQGGVFRLAISLPANYPFSPPIVRFVTKIWHPNISSVTGYVCLDILNSNWAASMTLRSVLLSLQALLQEPVPDDPQDAVVARQAKRSKKRFTRTARYWTFEYAIQNVPVPHDLEEMHRILENYVEQHDVSREHALAQLSRDNWKPRPPRALRMPGPDRRRRIYHPDDMFA